jgi:gamma-glutamyltranspeptidase/glutathione hydrolase
VPVERLTSKVYAAERRSAIDPSRAQAWSAGVAQLESAHTTHMTAADAFGNVVATTQTINNLFGAKILIPGLGTVPNNYMNLYDPRPGHALSLAPGKRVTTSMSPMMALRGGKLVYALGLPGGKRIFPSAMQALINLIDHGMSLQEAVEAPRVWTEGNALEVERAVPESVRAKLAAMGHKVLAVPTVAGGMNAIQFHEDGTMSGAACWRADGTPIGIAGGLARAGVRFGLA